MQDVGEVDSQGVGVNRRDDVLSGDLDTDEEGDMLCEDDVVEVNRREDVGDPEIVTTGEVEKTPLVVLRGVYEREGLEDTDGERGGDAVGVEVGEADAVVRNLGEIVTGTVAVKKREKDEEEEVLGQWDSEFVMEGEVEAEEEAGPEEGLTCGLLETEGDAVGLEDTLMQWVPVPVLRMAEREIEGDRVLERVGVDEKEGTLTVTVELEEKEVVDEEDRDAPPRMEGVTRGEAVTDGDKELEPDEEGLDCTDLEKDGEKEELEENESEVVPDPVRERLGLLVMERDVVCDVVREMEPVREDRRERDGTADIEPGILFVGECEAEVL